MNSGFLRNYGYRIQLMQVLLPDNSTNFPRLISSEIFLSVYKRQKYDGEENSLF